MYDSRACHFLLPPGGEINYLIPFRFSLFVFQTFQCLTNGLLQSTISNFPSRYRAQPFCKANQFLVTAFNPQHFFLPFFSNGLPLARKTTFSVKHIIYCFDSLDFCFELRLRLCCGTSKVHCASNMPLEIVWFDVKGVTSVQ